MEKQKKQFRMPTAFTVLILLTIVVAVITRFIPAITPATVADVIMAPIDGFASALGVALFVLVLFGLSFVVMIVGMIPWGSFGIHLFDGTGFLTGVPLGEWYFSELTAWFLVMAIVAGLVYGLKEREIVSSFLSGAGDLIGVALVIAVSRGVSVIMSSTGLDMYILEKASEALQGTSSLLFTALSYIVYLLLSVLIPSSSGLATVSMPIMGPLAQNLGLVPEIMVCVLSGSCALVNCITPTSGTLMGVISICRIEFSTWVKYIWKPLAIMLVIHIAILSAGMVLL